MKAWKVKVRCDYTTGTALVQSIHMRALVVAIDSEDALHAGLRYVESQAPSDRRWLGFEAIEAAALQLPAMIATL